MNCRLYQVSRKSVICSECEDGQGLVLENRITQHWWLELLILITVLSQTMARGSVVDWGTPTRRKVAGSSPDERSLDCFRLTTGPGIGSASNTNEYQKMCLGSRTRPARKADSLTARKCEILRFHYVSNICHRSTRLFQYPSTEIRWTVETQAVFRQRECQIST
jgi:hypothetical protein